MLSATDQKKIKKKSALNASLMNDDTGASIDRSIDWWDGEWQNNFDASSQQQQPNLASWMQESFILGVAITQL